MKKSVFKNMKKIKLKFKCFCMNFCIKDDLKVDLTACLSELIYKREEG